MNINYIWKGPKKQNGSSFVQQEINLLEADKNTLSQCYDHCMTMLHNKDEKKPGRKYLYDIVKDQITKCNVAIYIKEKQKTDSIMNIVQALKGFGMDTTLKEFISVDPVFEDLKVSDILNGALDKLGFFFKNHITLTGLVSRRGIKIDNEDYVKMFKGMEKDEIINYYRTELKIPNDVNIKIKPTGLTSDEIKSIMEIRNMKYSDLTKNQLTILRDKVLPDILNEIEKHINFWEIKANIINYIQKDKGYID